MSNPTPDMNETPPLGSLEQFMGFCSRSDGAAKAALDRLIALDAACREGGAVAEMLEDYEDHRRDFHRACHLSEPWATCGRCKGRRTIIDSVRKLIAPKAAVEEGGSDATAKS